MEPQQYWGLQYGELEVLETWKDEAANLLSWA